ncbi:MAG TPA: hypothetical protein VF060_24440 [Trebonia sp.]
MYQPYPGGSAMPDQSRKEPPPSIVKAVKAMQAGVAASLVGIILNLATVGSLKSTIRHLEPHATAAQITMDQRMLIGESIAAGLIGAALWLWMAQSCRAGKAWARTLSTVLFGIYTIAQIASVAIGSGGVGEIYNVVVWLIGLVAVIFLWQQPSTEYFRGARRI